MRRFVTGSRERRRRRREAQGSERSVVQVSLYAGVGCLLAGPEADEQSLAAQATVGAYVPLASDGARLMRDWIAWKLANLALRIATPRYRNMIDGSIRYGLHAAARDSEQRRAR